MDVSILHLFYISNRVCECMLACVSEWLDECKIGKG